MEKVIGKSDIYKKTFIPSVNKGICVPLFAEGINEQKNSTYAFGVRQVLFKKIYE